MARTCGIVSAGIIILLALVPPHARAGDIFPNIVVTVPALTPYANALVQGIGHADDLLRPGQDAHDFTLNKPQRELIEHADVILVADRRMAPQLDKLLDLAEKKGAAIIELSSLKEAQTKPYTTENPWLDALRAKTEAKTSKKLPAQAHEHHDDHDAHDHHDEVLNDPHLWLDPLRMADLATPIAQMIAEKTPVHRATLLANAKQLSSHLRHEVTPALKVILQPSAAKEHLGSKPHYPFITYHNAYQYFMTRFDLHNPGEITDRPEEYFGAKALHDVIEAAQAARIQCIVSESSSPLVKRIAAASGARVVALSPEIPVTPKEISSASWAQNDYDRLLQKTAESFADCM